MLSPILSQRLHSAGQFGSIAISVLALLIAVPARAQDNSQPLIKRLRVYHYGTDQALQEELFRWAADAARDPAQRARAADGLASVLKSEAPFDAKELACRNLVFVAGDAEVPILA